MARRLCLLRAADLSLAPKGSFREPTVLNVRVSVMAGQFQSRSSPYSLPRNPKIRLLICAGFSTIMKCPTPSISSDSEPSPR